MAAPALTEPAMVASSALLCRLKTVPLLQKIDRALALAEASTCRNGYLPEKVGAPNRCPPRAILSIIKLLDTRLDVVEVNVTIGGVTQFASNHAFCRHYCNVSVFRS